MARKLFCELSPTAYKLSVLKGCALRRLRDAVSGQRFAKTKSAEPLPHIVYKHASLIRRTLGNVDARLQENKAVNLALTAPKITGVLIRPGETFSFWRLAGNLTAAKGYKEGLTISNTQTSSGIGGGMCQFTNLIHWMILHSPLDIVEHHHHDGFDLFPDFNRQVPFGTGTAIAYNYLDYRFKNNTDTAFQLIAYVTDTHLCGELRAADEPTVSYHIQAENEHFTREDGIVYRNGEVYRTCVDKRTGNTLSRELVRTNHAQVLYDTAHLTVVEKTTV